MRVWSIVGPVLAIAAAWLAWRQLRANVARPEKRKRPA